MSIFTIDYSQPIINKTFKKQKKNKLIKTKNQKKLKQKTKKLEKNKKQKKLIKTKNQKKQKTKKLITKNNKNL